MSRIIVKNLPIKADEAEIRKHFEAKQSTSLITDVKLLRKRDGTSRKFAFIGFKTNEAAQDAAKYFNKSFMTTSQLSVEVAKDLHDETLVSSRERRKRKLEAEAAAAEHSSKKHSAARGDTDSKDAQLKEFLNVMQPQSTTAMWKNADDVVKAADTKPELQEPEEDEDMQDLTKLTEDHASAEPQPEQEAEPEAEMDTDEELENMRKELGDKPQEDYNEDMTDLDWLKSKRTRIKDKPDTDSKEAPEAKGKPEAPRAPIEDSEPVETLDDQVLATGRLFLRNLSYSTTEAELSSLFNKFGANSVHVPVDRSDKPKGLAFVSFTQPDEALAAFHQLDGMSFQGRLLHILPAKPTQKYELDEFDLANMPLKKQQLLKRKQNAAKQQFSWNSLYLNRDAVLETAAKKLGITKAEMMDPHSSNMAVKAALAESSVLESVQTYFKGKGVDLAKLEKKKVTDKIILVKNIPFGTTLEELSDLFGQYGELVRVLMPPDGGIAIVQFVAAPSGRAAFTKLAFRRLGNSILYLQKAPEGLLDETSAAEERVELSEKQQATSAKDLLEVDTEASEVTSAVHASVFIKNLNFSTTSKELSRLFKKSPGFVTAQVKTKPGKTEGTTQSMGYGFAEFDTLDNAELAIKAFQGYKLDNHALQLKASTRGKDEQQRKKASTSKIVIKNVPFETTRQDVYDLFGTFGQLRSLRLPRKFNKQTRGFAFAEFATVKEAETAMAALSGAHLLGRRLVMEYAQADAVDAEEEIARMEKKVQSQVDAEQFASMRSTGQHGGFDMDEE